MSRRLALTLALCLAPLALSAQPRRPAPRARPPAMTNYRVAQGDTCASIAQRVYRDVRRTHLIHENNPSLGRPPHRLRPGMTLRLPRAAPRRTEPDAILTETRNVVEIGAPAARRARGLDPLFRGTTVSTGSSSTAEVTFADETQLRMSEQTTVVILGESNTRVRRLARAGDTTLVRGTLRAFLDDLSAPPTPAAAAAPARPPPRRRAPARRARPLAIRTARGRVVLSSGEAGLSAGEGGAVTLSVYRGQSRIQSGRRSMLVREGFAVRAEEGRPMTQHRLPLAPTWRDAPPPLRFSTGEDGRFEATWSPGVPSGGAEPPAVREWHVQVARDPSFLTLQVDTHLDPADTRVVVPGLRAGTYYARVSAVDAERFEGPFAPVAAVRVVTPRLLPTPVAYRSLVGLGEGLRCGLDGAPLASVSAALPVERRRAHTLRCALEGGDDAAAVETSLSATARAPLTLIARLVVPDPLAREGHVRIQVIDHEGETVDGETLRVRAPAGVTAGELSRATSGDPGFWLAPVRWTESVRGFALDVRAGDDALRTETFVTPEVPTPPEAPDGFVRRLFARGDVLGGYMLSDYQRNATAANFGGNALGISAGVGASLRLGVDAARPRPGRGGVSAGGGVMASTWIYPTSLDRAAVATMYGAGAHVGFTAGRLAPWADANAGVVLTGSVLRFGVDLGVGLDVRVSRALSVGPTVRYVHVVQPESAAFPEDARTLAAGLALTLRAE